MAGVLASRRMCAGGARLRAVTRVGNSAAGFRGVVSRQATIAAATKAPDSSLLVEMTPAEVAAKDSKPAAPTRTITMVKKLLPDGSACRKCNEIQQRLNDRLAASLGSLDASIRRVVCCGRHVPIMAYSMP